MPSGLVRSSGDQERKSGRPGAGGAEIGGSNGSNGSTDDAGAMKRPAAAGGTTAMATATTESMTYPAAKLHDVLPIRGSGSGRSRGDGAPAGNQEGHKRTQSGSDAHLGRRHRDRRAHTRRTRQRTGHRMGSINNGSSGSGHRRNSKLGLSAPQKSSAAQKAFSSRRPYRKMRSWLASFTGTAATARKKSTARKGKEKESSSTDADQDTSRSKTAPSAEAPRPQPKRLGKAELGKYADEDHMPDKVAAYLQNGWGVRQEGIVPVLGSLLEQSRQTEYAYLCDSCVQHVSRLPREGPFCGYRNIQTMFSYIVSAGLPGHDRFGGALPSIFDVQDLIETAWDEGYNAQGRVETGGVRGTRKYIGTPEAVAVFQSLGVPISVRALSGKKPGAVRDLLHEDVQQYFEQGVRATASGKKRKVHSTRLPPIYWQQPGHSVTIVGIERTRAGATNLLVLDPNYMKTPLLVVLLGGQRRARTHFPDRLLQAYRRSPQYVAKFQATEILKLQPPEHIADAPETSQQDMPEATATA